MALIRLLGYVSLYVCYTEPKSEEFADGYGVASAGLGTV